MRLLYGCRKKCLTDVPSVYFDRQERAIHAWRNCTIHAASPPLTPSARGVIDPKRLCSVCVCPQFCTSAFWYQEAVFVLAFSAASTTMRAALQRAVIWEYENIVPVLSAKEIICTPSANTEILRVRVTDVLRWYEYTIRYYLINRACDSICID